jgi:Ca2+-binding RTX toxin-like protein
MSTLFINSNVVFPPGPPNGLTNITRIEFTNAATATFLLENVLYMSQTMQLVGSAGVNRIIITMPQSGVSSSTLDMSEWNVDIWQQDDIVQINGSNWRGEDIIGTQLTDYFYGADGNDTLLGRLGNDSIDGGPGNDLIGGNERLDNLSFLSSPIDNDTLRGGEGNDTIEGSVGINDIDGGEDDDLLYFGRGDAGSSIRGGADNDSLAYVTPTDGWVGAESLDGGAGIDTLDMSIIGNGGYYASASFVVTLGGTLTYQGTYTVTNIENVIGGGQADNINGDGAANHLSGNSGDDTLVGLGGNDTLVGGSGNDLMAGGADNDLLEGRANNDIMSGGLGADTLDGGTGMDMASYAGAASGVVAGLAGWTNFGEAAGDVFVSIEGVIGSAFADILGGTSGGNLLQGGNSDDVLYGYAGSDTLDGGFGNDALFGGTGTDSLNGSAGWDTARYDEATDGVVVGLDGSGWTNFGEAAGDTFVSVEGIFATDFQDFLGGNSASNALYGRGGNDGLFGLGDVDFLYGGSGADTIEGGAENDLLVGDQGFDVLTGGTGADTFLWQAGDGSDFITDFSTAPLDVIRLIGSGFVSFAQLQGAITQTAGQTQSEINLGGGQILYVWGVLPNQLTADNFQFG